MFRKKVFHTQKPSRWSRQQKHQTLRNISIILGILLLILTPLSAEEKHNHSTWPLWAALPECAAAIDPDKGLHFDIQKTAGVQAMALDADRKALLAWTGQTLSRLSLDGELIWRHKLTSTPVDGVLITVPEDGSAWLAYGDRLESFGTGGQQLRSLPLGSPAQGLALDSERSRLWIATGDEVTAMDPIGGYRVRSLSPIAAEDESVRTIHLDQTSGDVWVATTQRLLRHDADGVRTLETNDPSLAAVREVAGDGHGGLWTLRNTELVLVDAEGTEILSRQPFGDEVTIQTWAFDAATRSLWLSDGQELVRLSASGWELERRLLSEGDTDGEEATAIRDLVVMPQPLDSEPPTVRIVSPQPAAKTKANPWLEVDYSDDRSGVRAGSLHVTVDGEPVDATCEDGPDGSRCVLDTSLATGLRQISVTVTDEMGNVSDPATVSFSSDGTEDGEGDDSEDPDKDGPDFDNDTGGGGTTEQAVYTPVVSARGFRPNIPVISASEFDHVDPSNGNLVVTIPLGQVYKVGPVLDYQFQPVYNSNLWQHLEVGCPATGCPPPLEPITFASTNFATNAGLGWEFHFGRLYAPIPPSGLPSDDEKRWPNRPTDSADLNTRWMYVSPSGAVTTLHGLGSSNNGTASLPVRYSKDGSFIRMRQVTSNEVQVHMPNGLISVFKKTGETAGTDFCGGGISGCWRFHETRDPYGNYMRVSYSMSGSLETWSVTDSVSRQHTITLSHSNGVTSGGDGVAPYATPEGDEWGDLRKAVIQVRLAASAGRTADYNFHYKAITIQRGSPHDGHALPAAANTIRTSVLDKISVPSSQPWRFQYWEASNPRINGRLIAATSPSRGITSWEYANSWWVPTRCTYSNSVDPATVEFDYQTTGVVRRVTKTPNPESVPEGVWTYSSELFPGRGSLVRLGTNCTRANYRVTTVDAARDHQGKHTRTVYYNSVAQGPRTPSINNPINDWQVTDNGLPFTKETYVGSNSSRRFLSQQIYHCNGSSCGSPKRSIYVRYTGRYRSCSKLLGDSPGCYQVNPLLLAQRTVFHDDGSRYIDVENLNYNGAGNFKTIKTQDNFGSSTNTRYDKTEYTVTGDTVLSINSTTGYYSASNSSSYLPSPSERWILHPYSQKTAIEDGRTYVTDFQFNSQGSMTCSRKRKNHTSRGSKDLVVHFSIGGTAGTDNGMPITETVAGGERGILSTSLCSTNGSASAGTKYVIDHAYQHLQLKSSRIAGFPYWYRAEIDRNTGLPSRTYNPSDQGTTRTYDKLGRPLTIVPDSSLGEARTEFLYTNRDDADFIVDRVRKNSSGTILTVNRQVYDHFGRPTRKIIRRPTGQSSWAESEQKTFYNALGWKQKITTMQNKTSLIQSRATEYLDYDAFGRPGRVKSPDGQVEELDYHGIRVVDSKVQVHTSTSGTTEETTTTVQDSRGRTTRVINDIFETEYSYDPFDQKVRSRREGPGINQFRYFTYDARGLLLSERHPEIGSNGNDWVTYEPDAFGNQRVLRDDGRDLTYVYDNAGRLIQIKETNGGREWRNWTWGSANSGSNYQKGKVIQEIRHNYPGGVDWAVYEKYEYRGNLGQVSKKTTELQYPGSTGNDRYNAVFSQTFGYDVLGNTTTYTYPQCEVAQGGNKHCDDGPNDVPGPSHTVTVTHNQGHVRSVTSTLGPSGVFSYHANMQISQLEYSNGVDGEFDEGTNGMVRPQRLRYTKGASVLYDSGAFGYDGAGNISQIGSDLYVYDEASRLLSGTVKQAGATRMEQYTYDAADNMVSFLRDGFPWTNYQVQSSTNRLLQGTVYDGAGNMTSFGSPSSFSMLYDPLNQLMQFDVLIPGQELAHLYAFGPGEKRLISYDSATQERTFRIRDLEGRVMREYKVNGWGVYGSASEPGAAWVFEKDYIHGPKGLIATRSLSGEQRFFHPDHLGSPRAISNSGGTRIGWRHYYPFGVDAPGSSGVDELTSKFTGHERDDHQYTDYMMARTYFYPLSRFASVDPARDGWNLYAYVGNNPINAVDPDGQVALGVAKKLIKLAVKGGDVAATFAGAIEDARTVADSNASFRERLQAGVSLATEIASPISARDAKLGVSATKGGSEKLLEAARQARDELAGRLGAKRRRPATVTGGYNTETGQVAARSCNKDGCAEVHVVGALGGDKSKVRFTEAVRPRNQGPPFKPVDVCEKCEAEFGRSAFTAETEYASDKR